MESLRMLYPSDALPQRQDVRLHNSYSSPAGFCSTISSTAILPLVGTGSFSNVYRLSDTRVIKVLKVRSVVPGDKTHTIYTFRAEARIYRALPSSPHLLKFYGSRGLDILELEYCPHGTVLDYIRTLNRSRSPNKGRQPSLLGQTQASFDTTQIAIQAIQALSHIHTHNVLHNDLGARQLLLDANLTVKLVDFGGSSFCKRRGIGIPNATHRMPQRTSSSSASSSLMSISSPPCATFEPSVKADLFALGSTFYEIFSNGYAPYAELRDAELSALFHDGVWPDLHHLEGNLGAGEARRWQAVILGCWEGKFECAREILNAVG